MRARRRHIGVSESRRNSIYAYKGATRAALGAAPPRHSHASGDRQIPRANVGATSDGLVRIVAGDGFDLRAHEGVTPPTLMRRSLVLLATDFAPRADVGAAPDILSSRLSLSSTNQERSVL
jgi:hypothetical protein